MESDQPSLGLQLKVLEHEHGDECCPNLNAHGVGAGPDEGFDLEILFERAEERFDLPAILVDAGDGRRGETEVVGQENELLTGDGIAVNDATQKRRLQPSRRA